MRISDVSQGRTCWGNWVFTIHMRHFGIAVAVVSLRCWHAAYIAASCGLGACAYP